MLHPLPPQLLKFVQLRNHSQQVVCAKLRLLGGKEDFPLQTHISLLCQAVPVPENNLTSSVWAEAEPKTSLLSLYSFFHLEWMEAKWECQWLMLPDLCAPVLICSACALAPAQAVHGGREPLCSCSRTSSKPIRACEQTHSPLGDRWLKQELRNI